MADPTTSPVDRIRIFNRDGLPIAEFRARVTRSWMLGDEGRAEFVYPSRKTNVVNDSVLRFGNWLLVESTHLPPWVGMIDVPRGWTPRTVTVRAYTPERLLTLRRGPIEQILNDSSGGIFTWLLYWANKQEATVIRAGSIWRGGVHRQETVNPTPLSDDLQRIFERSGEEYQWRPAIDGQGKLVVLGDWVQLLGKNTGVVLHEGRGGGNIEATNNILVEDGPIYNDILGYGDGMTWQTRPTATLSAPASQHRYGLRQTSKEYQGVSEVTTVQNNTAQDLAIFQETARTFNLKALNVGNLFYYLRIGNVFTLRFENIGFYQGGLGFETTVRIIGMMYDPMLRNKCEIVVEEVVVTQ